MNTSSPIKAKLAIRTLANSNENHHLWNNNGIWNLNYTVYPTPKTKQRVRVSLGTGSIDEARRIRDQFFADCQQRLVHEPISGVLKCNENTYAGKGGAGSWLIDDNTLAPLAQRPAAPSPCQMS